MLADLERAVAEAWSEREDAERAHALCDEALLRFLRAFTTALPSLPQRQRLATVLDMYEALAVRHAEGGRDAGG